MCSIAATLSSCCYWNAVTPFSKLTKMVRMYLIFWACGRSYFARSVLLADRSLFYGDIGVQLSVFAIFRCSYSLLSWCLSLLLLPPLNFALKSTAEWRPLPLVSNGFCWLPYLTIYFLWLRVTSTWDLFMGFVQHFVISCPSVGQISQKKLVESGPAVTNKFLLPFIDNYVSAIREIRFFCQNTFFFACCLIVPQIKLIYFFF